MDDLPEPLGPTMAVRVPGATYKRLESEHILLPGFFFNIINCQYKHETLEDGRLAGAARANDGSVGAGGNLRILTAAGGGGFNSSSSSNSR